MHQKKVSPLRMSLQKQGYAGRKGIAPGYMTAQGKAKARRGLCQLVSKQSLHVVPVTGAGCKLSCCLCRGGTYCENNQQFLFSSILAHLPIS